MRHLKYKPCWRNRINLLRSTGPTKPRQSLITFKRPRRKYGHPYTQQMALIKEGLAEPCLCWASQDCCIKLWQHKGSKSSGNWSKSFELSCLVTPHSITESIDLKVKRCQNLCRSPGILVCPFASVVQGRRGSSMGLLLAKLDIHFLLIMLINIPNMTSSKARKISLTHPWRRENCKQVRNQEKWFHDPPKT